jgi:chromosomal replication initiation ATPase DnaA
LAQQLVLDLGLRPAFGRDDFLVTPANHEAVALIDGWPNWPSYGAVLTGAQGAGKSHLAEVWRQMSRAQLAHASGLTIDSVPELSATGAVVVDGLSAGHFNETALFHLLNELRQSKGSILLTSTLWPLQQVQLSDLASRLAALPVAAIRPPDDALLRGVLVKLFSDRQIAVDEALVGYLVARMPRSLDTARQLVARIDAAALQQGVEVTRTFAGKVLADMISPDML